MKRNIRIIRTEPIDLTKKTQLNPKQLAKVIGGSGKGLSTKFNSSGTLTLEGIRRLNGAKKKSKRYVLFTDQLTRRLYVADPTKVKIGKDESPLTFNKKEALEFYWGFDIPERKIEYYNGTFQWQTLTL